MESDKSCKIQLSGETAKKQNIRYVFISKEDLEECEKYKWYLNKTSGYVFTSDTGETLLLHTFIARLMFPDDDDWYKNGGSTKLTVDHINRCKIDNTRPNLRLATRKQQQANRNMFLNNKSGVKGVVFDRDRKKWRAEITINYKNINLGRYDDKEDAVRIRDFAEFVRNKLEKQVDYDEIYEILEEVRDKFKISKHRDNRIKIEINNVKNLYIEK